MTATRCDELPPIAAQEAKQVTDPSAEEGDACTQYSLGEMYLAGEGVAQDDLEAHRWFNLSAVAGNEDATTARDLVAARMTPEQLAEAQQRARAWKPETTGK